MGCAAQLLRFAGFIAMFFFAESAYNPHMDNPCNPLATYDECVDAAGRWYALAYAGIAASALLSGVLLYLTQRDDL